MASKFQPAYDDVRHRRAMLAQKNPGAFAELTRLGKRAIQISRKAEAAGDPVVRRPKGWMKGGVE